MPKLEEFCELQTGVPLARKYFGEDGLSVIQMKDINPEGEIEVNLERSNQYQNINKNKLIKEDDILLIARGSRIKAFQIEKIQDDTIATSSFFILRPGPKLLSEFLVWYINGSRLPIISSAAIPLIQLSDMRELDIHVPDYETQIKIISAHKAITKAKKLHNKYYEKQESLLRGIVLQKTY